MQMKSLLSPPGHKSQIGRGRHPFQPWFLGAETMKWQSEFFFFVCFCYSFASEIPAINSKLNIHSASVLLVWAPLSLCRLISDMIVFFFLHHCLTVRHRIKTLSHAYPVLWWSRETFVALTPSNNRPSSWVSIPSPRLLKRQRLRTDPHPASQTSRMTTKRSFPSQAGYSKLDILAQNEIKRWSAVDAALGVSRVRDSSSETGNN